MPLVSDRDDAKRYQKKYKERLLTAKPRASLLEELKVTRRWDSGQWHVSSAAFSFLTAGVGKQIEHLQHHNCKNSGRIRGV